MTIGWQSRLRKTAKLERQRQQRLHRLLQKRKALDKEAEVKKVRSWNKRRGKVNAMAHEN